MNGEPKRMSDADLLWQAEAIEARGWHPDHSQNQLARALRELIAARAALSPAPVVDAVKQGDA